MRGACDGCLARVNGVPNVMTCQTPAEPDLDVRSQNTLGSRDLDFLRMTDWFFPDGMNHHELFAGVPGVQSAMQLFARRVAGLGQLPDRVRASPRSGARARRQAVEVLIVGAGPAGMAAALALARGGREVLVVDDGLGPGGGARWLAREDDAGLVTLRDEFEVAVAQGKIALRCRTVAAAVFGRDVLVVGAVGEEALVVEPRRLVLASGAHDGVVPFENNDFPGVLSARAACALAATGVSVGEQVVILAPALSPAPEVSFAGAFERQAPATTKIRRVLEVVRVKGTSRVRGVVVRNDGREQSIAADALLVDAPRSPAYELCEQAGAKLEHRPSGYVPVATRGKIAEDVWAMGEVTGAPLASAAFLRAAEEIARGIAEA